MRCGFWALLVGPEETYGGNQDEKPEADQEGVSEGALDDDIGRWLESDRDRDQTAGNP